MSTKALRAARAKLKANAALTAFFTGRYGRDARHFIGYKKPVNANDFPAICYVPISSTQPDEVGGMAKERVSIVIAINEPDITDDVFDGITQGDAIEALVLDCLEDGALGVGAMYLGEARITTDLGIRHPFYEREITVLLAAR